MNRILNQLNSDNIISLLVLLAGISICLALFFVTIAKEQNQSRLNFKLLAEETTSSIENSIVENSTTVGAIASFFSASGEVDRHGFSVFVRPFLNRNKSIQALQWVPRVLDKDRDSYEASARRDGLSDFHFKEWQKPRVLKIASVRKDYFVVYYNEPLLPNRYATGLDNGSEPVRYRSLLDSAMNGSETYSPPVTLLQSKAREKGYLIYQPVYTRPIRSIKPQERLKHLRGFAAGVFIMDKVLQSALGHRNTGSIYLEVIDVTDTQNKQTIGSIGIKGNGNVDLSYDRFHSIGNRRWCFHTVPGNSYPVPSHLSAWIKLCVSLAMVLIVYIFLLYRSTAIRMFREKEERFNQLTEQSRTVIWDVDVNGLYTYFSQVSEIVLGYRADEIIGKKHFYDIHPENGREAFKAAAFEVFARKEPFRNLENPIQTKDGRVIWVSTNGMPIIDHDGRLLGYRGSDTDITERKQAEEALRESEERFSNAFEYAAIGMALISPKGNWLKVNQTLCDILGYSESELLLKTFQCITHPDDLEADLAYVHKMLAGDISTYKMEKRYYHKLGNMVSVQLSVSMVRDSGRNPLYFISQIEDITERKRAEEEVRSKDKQLSEMSSRLPGLVFQFIARQNGSMELTYVTGQTINLLGLDPEPEGFFERFTAALLPDQREDFLNNVKNTICKVVEWNYEGAIRKPSGETVWISGIASPTRMGNDLIYDGVIFDITKRKLVEEALQKSETLQHTLVQTIPDLVWLKDTDGIYITCNAMFERFFGAKKSEIVGKTDYDFVDKKLADFFRENDYRAMMAGKPTSNEEWITFPDDGNRALLETIKMPMYDTKGIIIGVLGVGRDITERKLVEEALQESEANLRNITNSAQDAILMMNSDGAIIFWNPAAERILGYSADEAFNKDLYELLVPECKHNIHNQAFSGFLRTEHGTTIGKTLELHAIRKDKQEIIVSLSISAAQVNGKWGAVGILRDITAQKQVEAALAKSKAETESLNNQLQVALHAAHQHAMEIEVAKEQIEVSAAEMDYKARHDALTDLPNRLYFSEELDRMISSYRGSSKQFAVLFLDLDKFKMVNDTMGHKAGDTLLIQTAERLSSCLRQNDILARMGGDEFTVLLRDIRTLEDAAIVAQRMLDKVSIPYEINGNKMVIGVSIGGSIYPDNATDAVELLKTADAAMYKAKELGRNNYQFFSDEINQTNLARVEMERDLRNAIERDELEVYYQPITDVKTMQIIGAEALLRWDHPELGMISPGLFIPIAEETNLIIPMGRMVLETACKQGKVWHDAGYTNFEISVNVSPTQLSDIGFISEVHGALSDSGFPPNCLKLEVTETVLARNDNDEVDLLSILKSLGVSICLDDFGIGYSSLSRLNKLPIVHMKIDGCFIRNIAASQKDRAMTESIIVMAHNLGIKVTAEWIEDEDQMEIIKLLNCDYAQGYLVSPALSADDFNNFLKTWRSKEQSTNAA